MRSKEETHIIGLWKIQQVRRTAPPPNSPPPICICAMFVRYILYLCLLFSYHLIHKPNIIASKLPKPPLILPLFAQPIYPCGICHEFETGASSSEMWSTSSPTRATQYKSYICLCTHVYTHSMSPTRCGEVDRS